MAVVVSALPTGSSLNALFILDSICQFIWLAPFPRKMISVEGKTGKSRIF